VPSTHQHVHAHTSVGDAPGRAAGFDRAILLVSPFQKKPRREHVASCAMRPTAVQKPGLAIPEEDPIR
jgi:hypothetical protein